MSVYTIFPKRGIVDPFQSAIAAALTGPGNNPVPSEDVTSGLVFDCLVSEAPEYDGAPTQSLIEDANTISDHVVIKPLKLKVEFLISDNPLLGSPFGAAVNGLVSSFSGTNPSQKAFDYIENLFVNQAVFDFAGGFKKLYKNMVISSFRPVRDPETGSALSATMVMDQLVIVNSQVLIQPSNTKAAPKSAHGGQPTASASPTEVAAAGSAAAQPQSYYLNKFIATSTIGGVDFTPLAQGVSDISAWLNP